MPAAMLAAATMALAPAAAQAASRSVTVSVENLAPAGSVAVAPLRFGFHSGLFDAFDAGATAGNGIPLVAELADGTQYFAAFAAADPGAVLGSSPGPLTPGASGSTAPFLVDTALNPYFSFAAMVVPSNDSFIGNDNPTGFKLFDAAGNLLITQIVLTAGNVWDAGSETLDAANAAFVGDALGHVDENGVVTLSFANFATFNGLNTAAGYAFNDQLAAGTEIYRISFASTPAVPEPASWAMMIAGLGMIGGIMRRRVATTLQVA
jgi:hypothetical protein